MIFATQWLLFDIRMTFMGLKIANNGTFVFLFWLQGPYTSFRCFLNIYNVLLEYIIYIEKTPKGGIGPLYYSLPFLPSLKQRLSSPSFPRCPYLTFLGIQAIVCTVYSIPHSIYIHMTSVAIG